MDILSTLPIVNYNGHNMSNLTVRAELYRKIVRKKPAFYDYLIKDGERPDTVAFDYYGSEDYTWLVLMCANVFNPYEEWPKGYTDFNRYIVAKYGTIEAAMSGIRHYKYTGIGGDEDTLIARKSWTLSPESFNILPTLEKSGWTPVTIYQYEDDINEKRRRIKLLSNIYIDQIQTELNTLFDGS